MSGIQLTLGEAARALGAARFGADRRFTGVSIDSRAVTAGNLFVALRGERVDGHDYVDAAVRAGAAAVMIEQRMDAGTPGLLVDDCALAMGTLAAFWRARFDVAVAAVTGSNGKTTVKEMLAAILARCGPVLATRGNRNNELGVPLTLYELDAQHRHAVIEMGANHAGEIARLVTMARPRVGIITQCAPAHLEGFGSIDGVARAKGEMVASLGAQGCAVLNADDAYFSFWRDLTDAGRIISFGLQSEADVTGRWQVGEGGLVVDMDIAGSALTVRLGLLGRHNVANALAAAAAAHALGVDGQDIAAGLQTLQPVPGRLQLRRGRAGVHIIDDSYNANPVSVAAALDVLGGFDAPRWVVLGDMAELGADSAAMHRAVGEAARAAGVERLLTLGELSAEASAAFGRGGRHFRHRDELIAALVNAMDEQGVVLVKGSRSMQMEHVVRALTGD